MSYRFTDLTEIIEDEKEREKIAEENNIDEDTQLIYEDDFEEYAEELAIEYGIIQKDYLFYFDSEKWANDTMSDFTSIDIDGTSYLII